MGILVVNGASLVCEMGTAPGTLVVLPTNRVNGAGHQPAANISDSKPFANITGFLLCASPINPITATQTTAAQGVLTPGACTPMTATSPWTPGSSTVTVAGMPALTDSSICMCAYGGKISIASPGTISEIVG